MTDDEKKFEEQQQLPPLDDIENLYIGHFENVPAIALTQAGELPLLLRGELLFYGEWGDNGFVIQQLRRVAIFGGQPEPPEDDPLEVISFGGPLANSEALVSDDGVEEIVLKAHYRLLSQDDPLNPRYEVNMARLTWAGIEPISTDRVELREVKFETAPADTAQMAFVQSVIFMQPPNIPLVLAGSSKERPAPLNSLPSHCLAAGIPCGGAGTSPTVTRRLPIKFINLSSVTNITNICINQLNHANGAVCHIWRSKAALDLTVWPNNNSGGGLVAGEIVDGTAHNNRFGNFTNPVLFNILPHRSGTHIEVYIVDTLSVPAPGGGTASDGITYYPGTPLALCILARNKIEGRNGNHRLLAHELCHALNLDHPNSTSATAWPGSSASIAVPGTPSPATNTANNMRVLTDSSLVNEIVLTTGVADCFRPG